MVAFRDLAFATSVALLSVLPQLHAMGTGVFAHFMVGNTASFNTTDWANNIKAAQAAHIDAFALNIANGDATNDVQIPQAFDAAATAQYKLFFSFDYAGGTPPKWDAAVVTGLINRYSSQDTYYKYGSKPLVSTFEGPDSSGDWTTIKANTGCFFIPDWSSKGAKAALELSSGVADGLFSWAAWPFGNNDTNTYVDASYFDYLNGAPYMAPVSPWFYTNMPGYSKNWLWRGGDLWYDRWQQLLSLKDYIPVFIEIISWNDYGESHYVGPLNANEYVAFGASKGIAPFNYAENMPHEGWLAFLPYVIDIFKTGTATITQEGLQVWFRTTYANTAGCYNGGTTGNTAFQFQIEYDPADVFEDKIYFSALLASKADLSITIGGTAQSIVWSNSPTDGVGIYHGYSLMEGTGPVVAKLSRNGVTIATVSGGTVFTDCSNTGGFTNWNAWVGSDIGPQIGAVPTPVTWSNEVCTAGFGISNFETLCNFTCSYGYCPTGACVCTNIGPQKPLPTGTPTDGYPIASLNDNFDGLCSFACGKGYCPTAYCQHTKVPVQTPSVSPFLPNACTKGVGLSRAWDVLCQFSCKYGYCPIHMCSCTAWGVLDAALPASTPIFDLDIERNQGTNWDTLWLCNFACTYGGCDMSICGQLVDYSTTPVTTAFWEICDAADPRGAWYSLSCSNTGTVDPNLPPEDRWSITMAEDAWNQAVQCVNSLNTSVANHLTDDIWLPWSQDMMAYFHGPEIDNCGDIVAGDSSCLDVGLCSENNNFRPAAALILESFVSVYELMQNFYNAFVAVNQDVANTNTAFQETFAPSKDKDNKVLDIIIDLVGLGISLALIPTFNHAAAAATGASETAVENSKDASLAFIGAGVGIANAFVDGADPFEKTGAITEMSNAIIQTWGNTTSILNEQLWSGSSASVTLMHQLIAGGNGLETGTLKNYSAETTIADIKRSLYTLLLPFAFALGGAAPFIASTNYSCDDADSNPLSKAGYIKESDDAKTRACVDNKLYYLLGFNGICPTYAEEGSCIEYWTFSALTGTDDLDGTNWGGVTVNWLISASVATYVANDNKNGASLATGFPSTFEALWGTYPDQISEVPGIANISICSMEEVNINNGAAAKDPNYPCNTS